MEVSTLEYVIDPIFISRFMQLLPAYYKINRRNGLNAYQGSVLFTVYNEDIHFEGLKVADVEARNPMQRDNIKRNLGELVEKGLLTIAGEDKPRSKRYTVTMEGVRVAQAILRDALAYRGQKLNTMPQEGTFVQLMAKKSESAIERLTKKPRIVKEALRRIEEQEQQLKDKEARND